ncbi:zona pellucida sperm-binding protein 2 [Emydura macquarii macquarii]|uniref:zona pellucida sperm-binding protein 2 n=1 Tax=Emydura macquarii macquarii TaxID=1129001 RepID=UPI00352B38C6
MGLLEIQPGWAFYSMWLFVLLGCLMAPLTAGVTNSMALSFSGTVSCQSDKMLIEFPRELGSNFWQAYVVDASGEEIVDCDYMVDHERLTLTVLYMNCTRLEHDKHQLRIKLLMLSKTLTEDKNVTYSVGCEALQADEVVPTIFTGATNCTKDFMAVVFPRLIPSFADEHVTTESQMAWILSIDDGTRTHQLNLQQAMQQGYTFLADSNNLIFRVSFGATGVTSYKQDHQRLYTLALKLSYGPPDQRLTVESRMICAPGPATCNSTHMTIAIPAFPGILTAVSLENRNIPMNQLQANGISLDSRRGVKLHINKRTLKSRLYEECLGLQSYVASLRLTFHFLGEMVSMVTYPECPCDQQAPIAAVCTQDGYMDFEVLSDRTRPALDLDTIRLRDPTCKPIFKSPSNDMVRFHIPLNGCGTRQRFEGERTIYENEVRALWADLPPRRISRDSEFRLTVVCTYRSGDASLSVRISSLPPPVSSINQGPLSLILLVYPDASYLQPYSDDQYPIVKYLRQPIFLEVQVLNRNDPNIKLMLDDCWATLSQDPSSLPRWNIVVDGCDYELDNYRTVFHPVGLAVSYPNYRQRFEVKAFAFVSGDKALTSLVYFHCSALVCDRLQPDSPLCSTRCPLSARTKRDVVMQAENTGVANLPGPVIFVSDEWSSTHEETQWREGAWTTVTTASTVSLGLMVAALVLMALLKSLKRKKVVM